MNTKNNKIILIRPRSILYPSNYPPFNLILLGSVLAQNGFSSVIMDAYEKDFFARLEKAMENALYVGLSVLTPEVPHAILIAQWLRKKTPNIPIVWGGWHATLFGEQIAQSDLADFVIQGDGEDILCELTGNLASNNTGKNKLLGYIGNHSKIENLPIPDYNLYGKIEAYIKKPLTDIFQNYYYNNQDIRWLPYQSSRGCPGQCTFCINVVAKNRKYRAKSANKTIDEIEYIVKNYKLNHIKIIDDNFFGDIRRAKEIIKGINNRNLNFTWDVESRVDYFKPGYIDDDFLKQAKDAGLVQFTFGIESGSIDTLGRMKKNITPEQAIRAVAMADTYGIFARSSFILDIPGDTKSDILETVKLINRLRKYKKFTCGVHTYRPYPRSELAEKLLSEGILYQPQTLLEWNEPEHVKLYTSTDVVRTFLSNYKLSSRVSFYQSLESGMWLKPHMIKNVLYRLINSFFYEKGKIKEPA